MNVAHLKAGLEGLRDGAEGMTPNLYEDHCKAVLEALDLLVRIRADDECGDTRQSVRSETWTLLCEAADAVEASR